MSMKKIYTVRYNHPVDGIKELTTVESVTYNENTNEYIIEYYPEMEDGVYIHSETIGIESTTKHIPDSRYIEREAREVRT